jgi:hypothetical protein
MNRFAWTFIALASLSSLSLAKADQQPFPETVPALFKVEFDAEMWGVVTLEFKDGRLIYQRQGIGGNLTTAVRPTLDQWARFFREINAAKVYKWSDHYSSPETARDAGFHWSIDLQAADTGFHSNGSCEYPLDGDLTEEERGSSKHKSYDLFMEAVSHLIGRGFPSDQ